MQVRSITLVRHGRTAYNKAGRIQGSQSRVLCALASAASCTRSFTPSTLNGSGAANAPTLPNAFASFNASVR